MNAQLREQIYHDIQCVQTEYWYAIRNQNLAEY